MSKDLSGTTFADKFRIISLLRKGSTGDYYRAINVFRDQPVTLKILDTEWASHEEIMSAFDEEARTLKLNEVKNLVRASDSGETAAGDRFIVIEDLQGKFLDQLLDDGTLGTDRAVEIAAQTASGARIAIVSGQLKRTLTKFNIFVHDGTDGPETVKLLDIGIDPLHKVHERMTADPLPRVDVQYMAPETIAMASTPDEISTVYSVGVVLYEMLANEPLFGGGSTASVLEQKMNDIPPPPLSTVRKDLPGYVETAMIKALAREPAARQQTLAEFAADIAPAGTGQATAAAFDTKKHDLWKTAFVVLAGISLLTVALIYATSVRQTDPSTQLIPDANGQPVQPINPATGVQEQNLASLPIDTISNSNTAVPPGTLPGGDGYDPWKNGVQPPAGAPRSGPVVTVDPNNPSVFMPPEGCIPQPSGILLCPAPLTNKPAKPTPTPKNNANANTQPAATPTPKPEVKTTPATDKSPAKPAVTPKAVQSGKPKNGDEL